VLQDVIDESLVRSYSCPFHKSRLESDAQRRDEITDDEDTERGHSILEMESAASSVGDGRMDSPAASTYSCFDIESDQLQLGPYGNNTFRKAGTSDGKDSSHGAHGITDQKLVDILVSQRAFNEGLAYQVLSKEPNGITYLFKPRITDKIKTGVSIARILVFQKKDEERLNMAIDYSKNKEPELNTEESITEQLEYLLYILQLNNINVTKFAQDTYNHFRGKLGKVNNLFFYGQPSTGKTTIMQSLVECHFNYTRLTGLNPNSTFNFASLLHTNACFMDECKLTDNQFEQWKLLASNSPMPTDVKYKESHDVHNCRLYTASNYPLGMFVCVPEAEGAIQSRTITYNFTYIIKKHMKITPGAWLSFWKSNVQAPINPIEEFDDLFDYLIQQT
jgi:hypothetical protein